MDEIADGVYALVQELEFDGNTRRFHPAAVATDSGVILIDVGLPGQLDSIESELEAAGYGLDDVELIVLTHQDGDHAGALAELQDRVDVTTLAPHEETPYVVGEEEPIKTQDERYPPARVDVEVGDGTVFRTTAGPMRVVETPGHTAGHVSLYLPDEKLLIAADALTADEDGLQGPNEDFTLEMDDALDSVDRLADLNVERTLCFHGGFVDHGPGGIAELGDSLR